MWKISFTYHYYFLRYRPLELLINSDIFKKEYQQFNTPHKEKSKIRYIPYDLDLLTSKFVFYVKLPIFWYIICPVTKMSPVSQNRGSSYGLIHIVIVYNSN